MARELAPFAGFHVSLARELFDPVVETPAQFFVVQVDAVHRDDRKISGQAAVLREVKQGRHQFPPGQITHSAKDGEHGWFEVVLFDDPTSRCT